MGRERESAKKIGGCEDLEGLQGAWSSAWCQTVLDRMEEGVLVVDAAERIRFANAALCRLTGFEPEELSGRRVQELLTPYSVFDGDHGGRWRVQLRGKAGRRNWVYVRAYPVDAAAESKETVIFVQADAAKSVGRAHDGSEDPLTGLIDRNTFRQLLSQLVVVRKPQQKMALLLIDIDRFEQINDVYNYELGDAVLKEVAQRIVGMVGRHGIVSRFSGDEFACLLTHVRSVQEVVRFANALRETVAKPMTVLGQTFQVTLSIGVSFCPLDAETAESFIQHANIAMYRAKEKGDRVQVFKTAMDVQVRQQLLLENELRAALQREDFSLHYQPQLDLATNRLTTVEVLLRWEHPEAGFISPAQFVPVAEETGIIVPLGSWVLRQACRQGMQWLKDGYEIQIAVNLSQRQFTEDDLVRRVREALAETGFPPRLLELEVTESLLIENPERVIRVMNEIKTMGVRFALDDYGTGYSNLSYLKKLPIDVLKLDQSFIRGLTVDRHDQAIVKSTITLAQYLGLELIAEGVENRQQLEMLRAWRCTRVQGYAISPPLAHSEVPYFFRQPMANG
nr:hypothetical protein [Bacillota bacterium]